MSRSHRYPSDLSDTERIILLPVRTILDGIFSILRGGCAWHMLPCDFPPWQTVHHSFRQ